MIFDTHAHYDDDAFDSDRAELLLSLKESGISNIVNVGASIATTQNTLKLLKEYPFMYGAVGVHPSETAELNDELLDWLKSVANLERVVAVGEIGLDYYWDEPDREIQKKWFKAQLELAHEVKQPVIIHSREAAGDTYEIMKAYEAEKIGGIVHCFSYTIEMAEKFIDMGFYLGIGGVLTFKNAKKLKEVVEKTPLERIVLETDCPYLSPEPNRGKRNSSLNLGYVADAIATIKGISREEVEKVTFENALEVYRIRKS
ncbi:MAG: TatD family hydrolase [Lachnospiraceae bacterium]|nr:TatD family hydrolase [Lachnospiraceae bacterium]